MVFFLIHNYYVYFSDKDTPLDILLKNQQQKIIKPDLIHQITVRRSHISSDAFTALQKGFDNTSNLRIIFLGEPGIDAGGPCREFFQLVVKEVVSNNSLFLGPEYSHSPSHNITELKKGTFRLVGEMLALSIIHRGPGPQCLSRPVVDYLTYGIHKVHGTVDDIQDPEMREKVRKVHYSIN